MSIKLQALVRMRLPACVMSSRKAWSPCDNKPKYLLIDLDHEALIYDLTEEEMLEIASKRITNQYKPAFEELSKN